MISLKRILYTFLVYFIFGYSSAVPKAYSIELQNNENTSYALFIYNENSETPDIYTINAISRTSNYVGFRISKKPSFSTIFKDGHWECMSVASMNSSLLETVLESSTIIFHAKLSPRPVPMPPLPLPIPFEVIISPDKQGNMTTHFFVKTNFTIEETQVMGEELSHIFFKFWSDNVNQLLHNKKFISKEENFLHFFNPCSSEEEEKIAE